MKPSTARYKGSRPPACIRPDAFVRMSILSIVVLLSATSALGQGNSPAALVLALNNKVLHAHDLLNSSGSSSASSIRAQAAPDILQREAALAALIASDPEQALKYAFSDDLLGNLRSSFPDSGAHFETHGTFRGILQSVVADDLKLKTSQTVHRLKTDAGMLTLHFAGPVPKLRSGMTLSVTGVQAGGAVAADGQVGGMDSTGGPVGAACSTIGAQNIATILVNLPDYTLSSNVTADLMNGILYGNANAAGQSTPNWSVDDYWQQNSDGLVSAPVAGGTVVGPFQLSADFNTDSNGLSYCDYMGLSQAAINAADGYLNFQNFNRVVVVFPYNGACGWAGLGTIGCWTSNSPNAGSFTSSIGWLRADQMPNRALGVQLAVHELGHGLGLHHASSRDFETPVRQPLGQIATQGNLDEYGDPFSSMGAWSFGFYPASQAQEILGWLGQANYQVVQSSGQYSVQAYETRGASGMVKALKIQRDAATNSWIWLEYRTNTGIYDSQMNSQVWSGALIHYEDSFTGIHSHLLDFTPATASFADPALSAGQTWVDPYTNLSITVNSIAGSALNVTITYGPPPCVPANPTVAINPPNPTVSEGAFASYAVTLTNNDTAACSPSTFNLTVSQPSGFTGTLTPTAKTIAPGASAIVTLTEQAGSTAGTYPIAVAATNASNSNYTATGTASITSAATCTMANPSVTMSPAGATLLPSGSVTFTVTVKNNDSTLCTSATYSLTATQPSGLSGTLSKTSLTLSAGAASTVTLSEKAGTTAGTFPVAVAATKTSAPTYNATGTANVTVAPCTLASPTVTLSPLSTTINTSTAAVFTALVLNNNSLSCASATYSLAATTPTGLTGSLSASYLTIASGSSATATLKETAGTTTGTFSIALKATNSSSSTSTGTGTASVTVVVPPCVLANPTVTLSPSSATINTNAAASLTATVKNNNSSSCASAIYKLAATTPTGLTGSLSTSSVSVASGSSGTATLIETAGTAVGTYSIALTATNSSTSSSTGTGTGSVTVVLPCTLANPTVTLSPASAAINISTAAVITATVTNNNSSSCAAAGYKLAATTPTGLSGSLSTSSLTIASGASATATLTDTAGTTAGTYSIAVTATNSSSSTSTGKGTGNVTVVAPAVTVTTDAAAYKPLATVTMTVYVAGATPVSGASVTFTLKKSSGSTVTYTVKTGTTGNAVWAYKLASTDPNGTYTASAAATVSNIAYKSNTPTFTVSP